MIVEVRTFGVPILQVLLTTSCGEIDVELWAKETPKACRNFIQLCMEGYYDNTIFHRIVKGALGWHPQFPVDHQTANIKLIWTLTLLSDGCFKCCCLSRWLCSVGVEWSVVQFWPKCIVILMLRYHLSADRFKLNHRHISVTFASLSWEAAAELGRFFFV